MIPPLDRLRFLCERVLAERESQGHEVAEARARLEELPPSYDALITFGDSLDSLPLRADWPWDEPLERDDIIAVIGSPSPPASHPDASALAPRIENAFRSALAGCMLGKPLEVNPRLPELRAALSRTGEWPLCDYVSEQALDSLALERPGRLSRHDSWTQTTRGNIRCVAADDDIDYAILGMQVIESHGTGFSRSDVRRAWLAHLAPGRVFGAERNQLARFAVEELMGGEAVESGRVRGWNPGSELCGAAIRAHAYGYAAAGNPAVAARMALEDAGLTHERNGVYAAMYLAAAIAAAAVLRDALAVHRLALSCIPPGSRLAAAIRFAIGETADSGDWYEAWERIAARYGGFGHCRLYQEVADLVPALYFAKDPAESFCLQVMMGNDTDSFGCAAGSIAGMFFGADSLPERWSAPWNDTLQTGLAGFHEQRVSAVAWRMGELPRQLGRPRPIAREATTLDTDVY